MNTESVQQPADEQDNADELACQYCGGSSLKTERRLVEFTERRVSGSYWDELTKCESCGQEWYTYDQSLANSAAYAGAIAKAQGSPDPQRIKAIRCGLDFTQEQMEQAMDIGPKTYIRWEKGYVAPSRAAASLLWIAENHKDAFRALADYRKNRNAEPSMTTTVTAGDGANPITVTATGFTKKHLTLHAKASST